MSKFGVETQKQREAVAQYCRDLFSKKLYDYGASWRILRPSSLTDQIYIKTCRIRSIQESGENWVGDNIEEELIGIFNYGLIGLIQLNLGAVDQPDIDSEGALQLYDYWCHECFSLMDKKNHDYGEAWRNMRVSSIVDLILSKVHRTKQIEDLEGRTIVSEGIEANYMDIVNYAVFALILLDEQS